MSGERTSTRIDGHGACPIRHDDRARQQGKVRHAVIRQECGATAVRRGSMAVSTSIGGWRAVGMARVARAADEAQVGASVNGGGGGGGVALVRTVSVMCVRRQRERRKHGVRGAI